MKPIHLSTVRKPAAGLFILIIVCLTLYDIHTHKPFIEEEILILQKEGEYPVFVDDDNFLDIEKSIQKSMNYLDRLPDDREFQFGSSSFTAEHMKKSLLRFQEVAESRPSMDALNEIIRREFFVFKSRGGEKNKNVLFTGYYEPMLNGCKTRSETFSHPIYPVPPDMKQADLSLFSDKYKGVRLTGRMSDNGFVPYFNRHDIDYEQKIMDYTIPIVWIDDPVDVFFLHIQGSGKVRLAEGGVMNVHYHAANGRPYKSIGKYLIDAGKIPREEMSMQRIRSYLNEHPEEMETVFSYNPSYVFFKEEEEGPIGCLGEALTPQRSLAVDKRLMPMAGIVYIETEIPEFDAEGNMTGLKKSRRFMPAQDTGGAIKGPGRADIYFGSGRKAGLLAGHMKYEGEMYFLVLKK